MVAGRNWYDLDLYYLIKTEAKYRFYSNAVGGSWAIDCALPVSFLGFSRQWLRRRNMVSLTTLSTGASTFSMPRMECLQTKNRDRFWFEIVKNAPTRLRRNDCKKLKEWILYGQNQKNPALTNAQINIVLKKILRPSMVKFFNSPVVAESHQNCTLEFNWSQVGSSLVHNRRSRVSLSDELYAQFYVGLGSTSRPALVPGDPESRCETIFCRHAWSTFRISHFATHYHFPSERYFTGKQHIPTVFSTLD